jgi:hypothetical protein
MKNSLVCVIFKEKKWEFSDHEFPNVPNLSGIGSGCYKKNKVFLSFSMGRHQLIS